MKKTNLVGCCGISCGLCPRYQSKAKSRCLGCGPDGHCSYCSIYRCCVTKRDYQTCADCAEFPCEKFRKWFDGDSFVTHHKCLPNIRIIQKVGERRFLKGQKERQKMLEKFIGEYDSGRCVSLYSLAAALLDVATLREALKRIKSEKGDAPRAFKSLVLALAKREKIELKLRR